MLLGAAISYQIVVHNPLSNDRRPAAAVSRPSPQIYDYTRSIGSDRFVLHVALVSREGVEGGGEGVCVQACVHA